MLFTIIENAHVILVKAGVYRQAKLYTLGDDVFAQYGGGFVGLRRDGVTTVPALKWRDLDIAEEPRYSPTGRMIAR